MELYNIKSGVVRLAVGVGFLGLVFACLAIEEAFHWLNNAWLDAWVHWLVQWMVLPVRGGVQESLSDVGILFAYMILCLLGSFLTIKLHAWSESRVKLMVRQGEQKARQKKKDVETLKQRLTYQVNQYLRKFLLFKKYIEDVYFTLKPQSYILLIEAPLSSYTGLEELLINLSKPFLAQKLVSPSNKLWLRVKTVGSAMQLAQELYTTCKEQILVRSHSFSESTGVKVMVINIDESHPTPELAVVQAYEWLAPIVPKEAIICSKRIYTELKAESSKLQLESFGHYMNKEQLVELFLVANPTQKALVKVR